MPTDGQWYYMMKAYHEEAVTELNTTIQTNNNNPALVPNMEKLLHKVEETRELKNEAWFAVEGYNDKGHQDAVNFHRKNIAKLKPS